MVSSSALWLSICSCTSDFCFSSISSVESLDNSKKHSPNKYLRQWWQRQSLMMRLLK